MILVLHKQTILLAIGEEDSSLLNKNKTIPLAVGEITTPLKNKNKIINHK
jgi:hypothetical protein